MMGLDKSVSRRCGELPKVDNDQLTRHIPEVIARLRPIDPVKIILFGSAADGTAGESSDLDLLVVTKNDAMPANYREKEAIYLEVARLLRDIRQEVSIDLIVHTQPMHARFIEMDSLFAREIQQKGVVIYQSEPL